MINYLSDLSINFVSTSNILVCSDVGSKEEFCKLKKWPPPIMGNVDVAYLKLVIIMMFNFAQRFYPKSDYKGQQQLQTHKMANDYWYEECMNSDHPNVMIGSPFLPTEGSNKTSKQDARILRFLPKILVLDLI